MLVVGECRRRPGHDGVFWNCPDRNMVCYVVHFLADGSVLKCPGSSVK